MVTIKDIIRDAVKEALKQQEDAERESMTLGEGAIEAIATDAATEIKEKIVG